MQTSKKDLEAWYSALGILSGVLGVLSLGIRLLIINIDKEKPKKEKYTPPILPLSQTLYDLS